MKQFQVKITRAAPFGKMLWDSYLHTSKFSLLGRKKTLNKAFAYEVKGGQTSI